MLLELKTAHTDARRWVDSAVQREAHHGLTLNSVGTIDGTPLDDVLAQLSRTRATLQATLFIDFPLLRMTRTLPEAFTRERLDEAVRRTLLGVRGIYYATAPWGIRRYTALFALKVPSPDRKPPQSVHEQLEARWLRASYRAVGTPPPPYLDRDLGWRALPSLLAAATPDPRPTATLAIEAGGKTVGSVVVRQRIGPTRARTANADAELPAYEETHPQFRPGRRWEYVDTFLRHLRDATLRPVGQPKLGRALIPSSDIRSDPVPTNELIPLVAQLDPDDLRLLDRAAIERAFLLTWPDAERAGVTALRYQVLDAAVHVQVALASVLPGNPFIGSGGAFASNLRRELVARRAPRPALSETRTR